MSIMKDFSFKNLGKDISIDIIGGILLGIGIYNFAAVANFPISGISGISLIFYHLFGLPIGLMTILLNIPIALFCYRILGHTYFLRSVKSLIITSLIIDYIAPLLPIYSGDRLLAAICTGVFSGLGFGIIYMNNTSTGGMDFIIMSIRTKNPHLSIGRIAFVLDVSIVLIGGFFFGDIDGIIYGIIVSFILSTVVDKLMYGIDAGKMTLIVTDYGEAVANAIFTEIDRGSTFIRGVGSYSKEDKTILMCACNNKQMFLVKQIAKKIDPNCFTIIMESNEVVGEGFKES